MVFTLLTPWKSAEMQMHTVFEGSMGLEFPEFQQFSEILTSENSMHHKENHNSNSFHGPEVIKHMVYNVSRFSWSTHRIFFYFLKTN